MKFSIVWATVALALSIGAVATAGGLERQQTPTMESHASTDGRIYKDNVLKDDDPDEDDKVLGLNHFDPLSIQSHVGSWGAYGDADGNGNALWRC